MKSIFCALSVLCGLNLLAEVTVHKAPLKSLLIENASVVTNVTATPEAAKKLESADGNSWLDVDGVKRSKQKAVEWDGLTAYSEIGDGASFNFDFQSPEWLTMSVYFSAPNGWHAQRSRIEDVEAGDGSGIVQEEVFYDFEATAPSNASSVVLYCTSDRTIATTIRISDAIREVDRFATTGEVARIASGITGGLTTNDVCAIVTNTVEGGWSEWVFSDGEKHTLEWGFEIFDPDTPVWLVDGGAFIGYPGDKDALVVNFWTTEAVTATRERLPGGNALGLATLKDLEGVSGAVPPSITNDIEDLKKESALIYRLFSGSNIIMEVTNYNSKVNPPAMKLLRLNDETGEYETMWTEKNGLERTYSRAASNTAEQVAALERKAAESYAPRAWSKTTSGLGADAPEGVTWLSTPQTVIAGGLEFQKTVTSGGQLWFLRSNGMMATMGESAGGFFEIAAADGTPVFSVEKTDSQLVGVDAGSISVDGNTVTVTVPVVSDEHPLLRYAPSLKAPVAWQKEEDGFSSPVAVAWGGSSGAWRAVVTTSAKEGFFTFEFLQEGSTKIKNGGMMDVTSGGIMCTDGKHKCRPVYNTDGTVKWEVF